VIWLWRDTGDPEVSPHILATFWYVLPSLPMFLLMPFLLRSGYGFWTTLAVSCALTIVLYLLMVLAFSKFGSACEAQQESAPVQNSMPALSLI